jgi:hypothetical protein
MLGRLIAILRFRRHTDCLTGHAKVMDGDTIVVAGQLVSPHGIDAPELDQTFRCQGHRAARYRWPRAGPRSTPWHRNFDTTRESLDGTPTCRPGAVVGPTGAGLAIDCNGARHRAWAIPGPV